MSRTAREGTAWALLLAVAGAMLAGMLLFAGSAWAQKGGCEIDCQALPEPPPDNGNSNGGGTIIWFWAGYPFPGTLWP